MCGVRREEGTKPALASGRHNPQSYPDSCGGTSATASLPQKETREPSNNMTASLSLLLHQAVPLGCSPAQSASLPHFNNNKTFKFSCRRQSFTSTTSSSTSSTSISPAVVRKMSSGLNASLEAREPDQCATVGRELRSLADSLGPPGGGGATGIHWQDLGPAYSSLCSLVLLACLRNISNKIFRHLAKKIIPI